MPSSLDRFMPKTRFQFPNGSILSVGTVSCDDQIHQAGYLGYTPTGSPTPTMELELLPKTVEVIIQDLQERANEARFVNGEKMLEYPKPVPIKPPGAKPARPRKKAVKQATSQSPPSEADKYRATAKPCPKCGKASADLAWFYFESPKWTWEHLCGRAGWMTVCDACHVQVDFFLEVMN